jgi:predicted AlkP superfamily phosphohydrolase/phosphomutase
MARRVVVIGLDSAPPELVFGELAAHMPNLGRLIERGLHGPLRSCHPPITIPAWQVMATSASPGRLGLYGFRHRTGHAYTDGWVASSLSVRLPTIWDVLGAAGRRSCLIGIPPGYPPKPLNGWSISCFLTPPSSEEYTHPPELRQEIEQLVGTYVFDVPFRVEDRETLRAGLFDMTRKRFDVALHLAATKPWDLFWLVEIGVDRLGHAFWKFFDRAHPKYEPGNPYEGIAAEYYGLIDERIGQLVELLPDAVFLVVSDHGSRAMEGAFCVNQWLADRGWLVLEEQPDGVVPIDRARVDWGRTRAWGWGGYYARIFLNVEGREPQGVIEASRYEEARAELEAELQTIKLPSGQPMPVQAFRPEELYPAAEGDRPDLMVYFDDLRWRSAGTIGHGTLYLSENDTGPDDSVHSMDGIVVLHDPQGEISGRVEDVDILDVAPTVLALMGLEVPRDMEGRPLPQVVH